jgi:2-polyprenyl-3-methyl-5-hydroxy-6-metoxy-1,4-benzoquinol methylase
MSYDARYYANYKPVMYAWDQVYWLRFFDSIARGIVETLHPETALDAGCAMGFLVSALLARGVDARGIDVSEYAIAQVPPWLQGRCTVQSITTPLDSQYNVISCIEVVEHLSVVDGITAIRNLCAHTERVLFSSTPDDMTEPTHLTVRPAAYWETIFNRNGFDWQQDYDASYVIPHARLYVARH